MVMVVVRVLSLSMLRVVAVETFCLDVASARAPRQWRLRGSKVGCGKAPHPLHHLGPQIEFKHLLPCFPSLRDDDDYRTALF